MQDRKSFLFDLNGTMINDMEFHLKVWHETLNSDLGANLSWEEVRSHMYGKNQEVLTRIFGSQRFTSEEADAISYQKEVKYQALYKPHLGLLPGLFDFIKLAQQNKIKMAIGSAASLFNIDFVLDNMNIRQYFSCIVSADDVEHSKPHPETYLKAAGLLQVDPSTCIVFEDAPKGVESARNAAMQCVVITSMHQEDEFSAHDNILMFVKDYTDPRLLGLL
jgi:beta-phosphoglucomutase